MVYLHTVESEGVGGIYMYFVIIIITFTVYVYCVVIVRLRYNDKVASLNDVPDTAD